MLNVLEKVVVGVAAFCALVTVALYFFFGMPSTTATAFVPAVSLVETPPPAPVRPGETPPPAPPALTQPDDQIVNALKGQNPTMVRRLRNARLPRRTYKVPVQLFEEVSKTANWTKQLKTAKSQPVPSPNGQTRLKIFNIEQDSYLKKFGIEENDIVELIDGQVVEFSEDSTAALYGMFQEKLDKLRSGDAISITVSRGGRPVHLEFKLPTQ